MATEHLSLHYMKGMRQDDGSKIKLTEATLKFIGNITNNISLASKLSSSNLFPFACLYLFMAYLTTVSISGTTEYITSNGMALSG